MLLNEPLARLLRGPIDPVRPVALGGGALPDRSLADFRADVLALASRAEARGERWLLETEDAYRVAVAFVAASAAGARVVLPPNLQPGTLEVLEKDAALVLVDAPSRAPGAPTRTLDPLDLPPPPGHRRLDIDREAPLVELFTSGSSGPGRRITKSLRHLEDEVVILERDFSQGWSPRDVVLATVPSHHLYGLLFRVLWPLAAGRPFARTGFLLPDDLLARVAALPGRARAVVVSSPAHLRHLAASPRLREQAPRIAEVFSSGGPLEARTALAIADATGFAPREIFGSTETGGVASRRARAADPDPPWTRLDLVTAIVDSDGSLVVTSPFVTSPDATGGRSEATWRMGDRAEQAGRGFRLLGRSDRVVKVGEKTVSMPEVEDFLGGHALVAAAAVGSYEGRSGRRLGAIVVLTDEGALRLAREGRRALQAVLAGHLASRWDRVAIPRRWRFRETLPVDGRGKVVAADVERELSAPARDVVEPLVLDERRDGGDLVRRLVVPRDLAYLEGHYDAFPLVPGVVQIHWVLSAVGRLLGRRVSVSRMEAVKFKNVLRPAQEFTMRLAIDEAASRVTFTLGHQERVFSSGRVVLAAGTDGRR